MIWGRRITGESIPYFGSMPGAYFDEGRPCAKGKRGSQLRDPRIAVPLMV